MQKTSKFSLSRLACSIMLSAIPTFGFSQSFTSITSTGLSMNKGSIHALIDYNNDGYEDVIFSNGVLATNTTRTLTLKKNNGNGTFADVTASVGLPTITSVFKALTFDYDRNGFKDIILLENGTTFRIFSNNGSNFTETTTSLGIVNPYFSNLPSFNEFIPADINKDGYLDILVTRTLGNNTRSISVITNNSSAATTRFNAISDLISGFPTTIDPRFQIIDYDNDKDDDLLVLNYQNCCIAYPGSSFVYHPITMYKNTGGTFTDAGISLPTASPSSFALIMDYNNDGNLDFLSGSDDYVHNKTLINRVVRNNGNSTFTDVSATINLRSYNAYYFGTTYSDFDNDSDFDVYRHVNGWNFTGAGNELYVNNNGTYSNQSVAYGLNILTYNPYEQAGGDPTWFDYDNDGDQDVFVSAVNYGNYNATSYFMRNNLSLASAKYLDIKLAGIGSSKEGIGARVIVYTNNKKLTQYKAVNNGLFNNLSSDILHYGLSTNALADSVNVFWPSGKVSRLYNVTANQKLTITEPSDFTTWTGVVSQDWNTAGNWTNGVPTATSKVTIPNAVPNFPLTTSGTINLVDITIASGASFTQTGSTFNVKGGFSNNGTFSATGGTISFNGSSQQTISGDGITTFNNLTIGSAGVSMGAPVAIKQMLTLTGNLATNGKVLTLLSDATGTAMIVNNPGTITGSITMQRYTNPTFNAGVGYRQISSPVQNATIADLATVGFTPVVNTAFNTTQNQTAVKPFPNVQFFDQSRIVATNATTSSFNFGYKSPASLSEVLTPGKGYSLSINAASKVDLVGTPNNGTVTVNNLNYGGLAASGWQLLGNPYPSPIDWDLVSVPSGFYPSVYVWRSTGINTGSWVGYNNGAGGIPNGILSAMQGFMVQCTTNVASFNFTNAYRVTTFNNPAFYRQAAETRPMLTLKITNAQQIEDEAYLYLENGATTSFEGDKDAYKIGNGIVGIATLAGTETLSVNGIGTEENQLVPLVLSAEKGLLTLVAAKMVNFENYDVQLEDKANHTFTSLQPDKTYSISHTGGIVNNRFALHLNSKNRSSKTSGMAVNVYPNPTASENGFTLVMKDRPAGKAIITICNSIGQTMEARNADIVAGNLTETFNTSRFAKGIYTISIMSGQAKTVKKIVVQ